MGDAMANMWKEKIRQRRFQLLAAGALLAIAALAGAVAFVFWRYAQDDQANG